MRFDVVLEDAQIKRLRSIPSSAWFDQMHFANVSSPRHPNGDEFDRINEYKTELIGNWLQRIAPGATVLDTFAANGRFALLARRYGAEHVTGVEYAPERVDAACFVADSIGESASVEFKTADVYEIGRCFDSAFDVVLCMGGLYHVADPPFILRQLRRLTGQWLIVQTSSILPRPGNRAHFVIREDRVSQGFTSIRGGSGVWFHTAECFRQMLAHGGFAIVEERRPPRRMQRDFPWFAALCRPV